jgi:hypothetical protein
VSASDIRGVTPSVPKPPDATPRASKRNGAAGKRSSPPHAQPGKDAAEPAAQQEPAAAFIVMEPQGIDAPMWPLHPVVWLQPDRKVASPGWSGLCIEHRYRLPAPGFLQIAAVPGCPPGHAADERNPLPPGVSRRLPESDLIPLGWDPRAAAIGNPTRRNEGNE